MKAIAQATPAALAAQQLGFDTSILAGQLAPSSIATYTKDFRSYLSFAGSAERALQAETLAQWRSSLATSTSHSPNTINRMIAAVKRLVAEAAEQGYCSREVALAFRSISGVKVKALKERQKAHARTAISPEDMRRLCSAPSAATLPGKMHRALLATLASSGCRISEVVSLTTAQIHFGQDASERSGHYLEVMGKNQTETRRAPISPEAHHLISQWLAARSAAGIVSDHIFTSFGGRGGRNPSTSPISTVGAWQMVQRYAKACELEHVKPHDFRRFVGTRLAKDNIRAAQKVLGHKRLETTAAHYVLDDTPLGLTDSLY